MVRNLGFRRSLRECDSRSFDQLGRTALAVFVALLFAGCQGGPRVNGYIEQMAAERRALENRVYELEYDLEVAQSELEHERSEHDRQRGGDGKSSDRGSTGSAPRTPPPPRRTSPRSPPSGGSGARNVPDDSLLKPPVIEPGDADGELATPPIAGPPKNAPPAELPPPDDEQEPLDQRLGQPAEVEAEVEPVDDGQPAAGERGMLAPPLAPAAAISDDVREDDVREDADQDDAVQENDPVIEVPLTTQPPEVIEPESPVASVKLLADPTGGVDLDDKPGDDGVTVAFHLRDERGRLVRLPGPVSVVVLDLAQKGPAARVARWDLDAEQVARLLPDGPSEEGLVLHMAWPSEPPKREQLQLHIRYVTPEGRKLEDHRDITIRLPGQRVSDLGAGRSEVIQAGGWRPKSATDANSAVMPAAAISPRRTDGERR